MNGTVVYDLTGEVDFSHPKKTAEALSKVLFERDVSKWINRENLSVTPTSKVELRIQKGHNRKIERAIQETTNDLKYEELMKNYQTQINAEANAYLKARAQYYWVVYSATNPWLAKKEMDEDALKHALHKITSKVFANITITTV